MEAPTICRYCGGTIRLVPAETVYGASTGRLGKRNEKIYQCQNCNARVGCHKGTNRPLGNVANEMLRLKRIETHQIFLEAETDQPGGGLQMAGGKNESARRCRAYRRL